MEQLLLYQMKHRFRSKIEIVRKEQVSANVETGRRVITQKVHEFDAVFEVTNNWLTRTFNRTDVDVNTKGWLIDPRDLPEGFEPSLNDTVQDYGRVYSHTVPQLKGVYQIVSVEDVTGGVLIITRLLSGSDQRAIKSPDANDNLELGDEGAEPPESMVYDNSVTEHLPLDDDGTEEP